MRPQFQHEATTSFALWLDNYLLRHGEAFTNKIGNLYYSEDPRIPSYPEDPINGLASYNSEYKQWVYNNDVNDAAIPSGVYIDSGDGYEFCHRGHSGLMFDFDNGRILLEGRYFGQNYDKLKVKTEFAVKDFNIYLADDTEENLIIQNKYNNNSRTIPDYGAGTGLPPYEQVTPAAFVSMENVSNSPFAFGGEDLTRLNLRVVLFTESLYHLDGLMSLCSDSYNLGIRNIGYDDYPLNEYGDTKDYYFSYCQTVKDCQHPSSLMYIENVRSSKISERVTKTNNPNLYLGFVDFEVSQARFTRAENRPKKPIPKAPPKPPPFQPKSIEKTISDMDMDWFSDAHEKLLGTNPLDSSSKPTGPGGLIDSDKDGFTDAHERDAGTNPNDPTSKPRTMFDTFDEL
jgi:hypothetical protein